jgi:hypothetical protein
VEDRAAGLHGMGRVDDRLAYVEAVLGRAAVEHEVVFAQIAGVVQIRNALHATRGRNVDALQLRADEFHDVRGLRQRLLDPMPGAVIR